MNPIHVARVQFVDQRGFTDVIKRHLDVFWRLRAKDTDCSFRIIPDEDKTLDLFTINNDLIF